MRIFLFTSFTPTKDNYRGPSAMMYHFFKSRPHNTKILIFTTNSNQVPFSQIKSVEKELDAKIVVLKDTLYNYFHRREKFQELRLKLGIDKGYNISNYRLSSNSLKIIKEFNPDFVWVYGEAFTEVIKQLVNYKLLVAGYDCFALHYSRLLKDAYCFCKENYYKKALRKYKIAITRELALKNIPCKYFDVGIEDRDMFETITGRKDALFYPHPHYDVLSKEINFEKSKLSILISGKLDEYTWSAAHELQFVLMEHPELSTKFSFSFLGKGWDEIASSLEKCGYEVNVKKWVDIYADEIVKHDIQVFPISVGSGTKGKVLDALSMGLLSIGTEIAMENIYVKDKKSCFIYKRAEDIVAILNDIFDNRRLASVIAENGRKSVLKWHNPTRIFRKICNDVMSIEAYDAVAEYSDFLLNED